VKAVLDTSVVLAYTRNAEDLRGLEGLVDVVAV
jgi:hypothetical protein